MLVPHFQRQVLYLFSVVARPNRSTISRRTCLREQIHTKLVHNYQSYPLIEPEMVANVSSVLYKASTVPFQSGCRTEWVNDTVKSLSLRINSHAIPADLPTLSISEAK